MEIPTLEKIDHIHINVSNRHNSEQWYRDTIGFVRDKDLVFWAGQGGPLTLTNSTDTIHLALFENNDIQKTTIAFVVSAIELNKWITHLSQKEIGVKPIDHNISWSIYFSDIDGNPFEITTYEYDEFSTHNSFS